MNTSIRIALVAVCFVSPVFAVVPPSTSMSDDVSSAEPSSGERVFDRRSHTPLERLEEDTRRLGEVLHDLQEDHQELKQSAEKKRGENDQKNP